MFRQGKARSFIHNVRLASMLSFVAGIVNINGVLSVGTLTTNVTGHFAFFAEELFLTRYGSALIFILFILFFLGGAMVSSFLVEVMLREKPSIAHAPPMLLEVTCLVLVALHTSLNLSNHAIAYMLLFAMGVQNALVTKISNATVRTTHLTGLFTDLGIELSQLIFYAEKSAREKLSQSIFLRVTIILCFFLGCVMGGFLFHQFALNALFFAATILVLALLYDNVKPFVRLGRMKLRSYDKTNIRNVNDDPAT